MEGAGRKFTVLPVRQGEAAVAQCPTYTVDAVLCAEDTPSVFLHLGAMCVCGRDVFTEKAPLSAYNGFTWDSTTR